jgi:hypothetical protein
MPLPNGLAASQRVWFALYPAGDERRLVNRLDEFEILTKQAGHPWSRIDLKGKFAEWIASVDPGERADWFRNPEDVDLYATTEWKGILMEFFLTQINRAEAQAETVFAVTGLMDLYDYLHVSDLLEGLEQICPGFLLVFFPARRKATTIASSMPA